MGKHTITACGSFAIVLVIAFGIPTARTHALGYLAKVGPVPLHFQPPRDPSLPVQELPPLLKEDPRPDSSAPRLGIYQFVPGLSLMTDILLEATANHMLMRSDHYDSLLPPAAMVSGAMSPDRSPVNDLLGISPQMLVNYFKPAPGGTNGVNVLVPVDFMPAGPTIVPDSSATYKTE